MRGSAFIRPRFFAAAPTRDQAKSIYWDDLKSLVPPDFIRDISETQLTIRMTTGAELAVIGMDKPQRIEGSPWDGGILDEYADMKAKAWTAHVRPALADRRGWCDLIGVPEGRNHYFKTYLYALEQMKLLGTGSEWGAFHWKSSEILPPEEIEGARRELDPKMFRQEYEASFEGFSGVVLHAFDRDHNIKECPVDWQAMRLPLHIGQDFNINPMSGTVWVTWDGADYQVDELVLQSSNTDELVTEVKRRYGEPSMVTFYPDPAGAQNRTSAQGRTDISILRDAGFRVDALRSPPLVRDRLNKTNARFCTADGTRRAFVSARCTASIGSYEQLEYKPGSNEPDKKGGFDHLVDATGYMMWTRYADQKVTINTELVF
ncbi:terminase [Pseudoroseomonas rhizosphaerae]|uniref:Terminase n=1 Tax=Teichococcus rhizosphaerae TaxID=1335062 RepID=A0A2C7A5L2_9PROT|nr:terminase [Pseudoroseomonas rhizosphaerae]PHK92883.1 terminase [Pseudoroseomonas rhizosphaerae]